MPQSFAEFNDCLTFITEKNIFKVPILARKEPPQIDLPDKLDIGGCWLGDSTEKVFRITNRGGEAGYRFFTQD